MGAIEEEGNVRLCLQQVAHCADIAASRRTQQRCFAPSWQLKLDVAFGLDHQLQHTRPLRAVGIVVATNLRANIAAI